MRRMKAVLSTLKNRSLSILSGFACPKLKVLTKEQTIEYVLAHGCSISRLGNGEMDIIRGDSKGFQDGDPELSRALRALKTNERLLLCVPRLLEDKKELSKQNNSYWSNHRKYNLFWWRKYYGKNQVLGDACLTRFYIDSKEKDHVSIEQYIQRLRSLWNDRDICFVEGEYSRLGVGNGLFDNARSSCRILCPAKNAFSKLAEIKAAVLDLVPQSTLLILALGPTASVLASQLSQEGYQALDLGHVDIEYEWFLRKAVTKIPIEGKHVNEVSRSMPQTRALIDDSYSQSIIRRIA